VFHICFSIIAISHQLDFLYSLSHSTASVSSGSSLGSLTSASSQSSAGYGLTDIFAHASQQVAEVHQIDLTLLHERVERLLNFREMNSMPTGGGGSQTAEKLECSTGVFPDTNKLLSTSNILPTYEQHLERQREQKVSGEFMK
jgi:hypothetical protein